MAHIVLLNDGDCWLCKKYSQYIQLKKKHELELKDAREEHEMVADLMKQGYDINNGVIAIIDDEVFQGKKAVRKIESLSKNETIYQKLTGWIIETPLFHLTYPIMAQLRIFSLKLKNKATHIPTVHSYTRTQGQKKIEKAIDQ